MNSINKFKTFKNLTKYHLRKCMNYRKIISQIFGKREIKAIQDIPYISVNVFKNLELKSIKNNQIHKIMLSSGTTGKNSRIYLDQQNSKDQIEVLNNTFKKFVSNERLPMLIVGQNPLSLKKKSFNAQAAAIIGFSIFSSKNFYLINEHGEIDGKIFDDFIKYTSTKNFFVFGFTFNIFNILIKKLEKKFNFEKGILIHGGGWKKLEDIKISNDKFKYLLNKKFKLKKIINYYGLIEQTGSVFFECKKGYFHTSNYNDILIRDEKFQILSNKKKGLVQLLSTIPKSYPGHSILTEDIGTIIGENDCKCGIKGKFFKIYGRVKKSEIRGCSNI